MQERKNKLKSKPIDATEKNTQEAIRNLEKILDDKVDIFIESKDKTGKRKRAFYFSSDNPQINIANKNISLDVEFSSSQQENEKLLHLLFSKTS